MEAVGKKQNAVRTVMYVEVNSNNFLNLGCYSLTTQKVPLFDIGIIFAANIKYLPQRKAWLYLNENVTAVLKGAETYIRPLQAKGIKVLLSILGGGEGAGVCNFANQEEARDFAIQLADVVNEYGLDGIDFDDEYAQYGDNNTNQPNPSSFLILLRELRSLIPDKLITFYFYGPASQRLSYDGMVAGDFVDYSWNAIYGTYSPINVPGLEKSQLGPAAVWVNVTNAGAAQSMATRTVSEGYGVYLCYDLPNIDIASYLNGISTELYGSETTLTAGCLRPWPDPFEN